MKKILAILFALTLVSSTVYAAENVKIDKPAAKPAAKKTTSKKRKS